MRYLTTAVNCIVFIVILAQVKDANAQVFKRGHATRERTPKFILVQLPTQTRKIEWFTKNEQNIAYAAEIKKDAEKIRQAIVKDFSDNFNFCPVYYYTDTNVSFIKEKKFNGVLLDKNFQPVSNADNHNMPYNVVIYTIGGPTTSDYNSSGNEPADASHPTGNAVNTLVVYDEKFSRIISVSSTTFETVIFGMRNKQYRYVSKIQDFEYRPYAGQLSHDLRDFYK